MWVLLLEKAFAKFCGSYSELSGGHAMWAMQAITGDYCSRWEFNDSSPSEDGIGQSTVKASYWKRYVMEYTDAKSRNPKKDWNLRRCLNDPKYKDSGDPEIDYNKEFMYKLIKDYDSKKSLIVASIMTVDGQKNEDALGKTGLVVGHTYTVTKVGEFSTKSGPFRDPDCFLVRMRNPWGQTEWELDYGDNDPRWQQPEYKKIWNEMMTDEGEESGTLTSIYFLSFLFNENNCFVLFCESLLLYNKA